MDLICLCFCWLGLGLRDFLILPDLIMPLIHTSPLEHHLASYLPEVNNSLEVLFPLVLYPTLQFVSFTAFNKQGQWIPEDVLELLQSSHFCY